LKIEKGKTLYIFTTFSLLNKLNYKQCDTWINNLHKTCHLIIHSEQQTKLATLWKTCNFPQTDNWAKGRWWQFKFAICRVQSATNTWN